VADPTTYASPLQHVGVAREVTQGTAVTPTVTVPVDKFDPSDQPVWIDDKALRGAMTEPFNRVQGVKHSEVDFGGPAFFDTIPYFLANVFGDVVYSGTYTGSGTTTLSAAAAVGDVSVTTVLTISASTLIQIDTGTLSEVRLTTGVSGGGGLFVVTFATALVNAHANTTTVVKPITAPYSTLFSVLNTGTAQPKSHTFTDYQGPTASTGTRAYPGTCLSELAFKGTVESSAIDYTAKGMGWPSASAAAFTSSPSAIKAQPSWETQVGLAGTVSGAPILTINDFAFTITRELEAIYTAQNSQSPYYIQRGRLTAGGSLNAVVNNETFLTYLNSNTQPQLQLIISNGLSGASLLSMQVDVLLAAFTDSKIQRGKAAVEYAANFAAIANTTNVGQSAGFGPIQVTIQNAIAPNTYPYY
jgi:hypothetical protein